VGEPDAGPCSSTKVDNKVCFVPADFADAGFTLLFFYLTRWRLHFDHLTGYSHFRFVSAFLAVTFFNLLIHGSNPLVAKENEHIKKQYTLSASAL
jgi:hypothetical protein